MKVTIKVASKALGCSPQAVRIGLQKGILPIGEAVQINGSSYTYIIPETKLAKYLGIPVEELERYQ